MHKLIKVIRKDATLLKSDIVEPDITFYFEDMRIDKWRVRTWKT